MRTSAFGVAVVAIVALVGCGGTTQIVTNDPSARIYVDGAMVGTGTAEITKSGTPQSAEITVKTADGRKATRLIDREVSAGGWVLCLMTYGIGCAVFQSYPDTVTVLLPEKAATNSWDGGDVWTKPPPGWTGPAGASTAPAGSATAPAAATPAPGAATTTPAPTDATQPAAAPTPAPAAKPTPAPSDDPWQRPPS
ncbi:MAG TPA: hypothetical protein VFG83_07905 [Kofleriaceae bacterium]|nr:hypothetical protein [Kofleriaceae bacterium]